MRYIGIYQNGVIDHRYELTTLAQNPLVKYILKIDEGVNSGGYHFVTEVMLIDVKGELRILTVGGFQLLDIGPRHYDQITKQHFVEVTLCETRLEYVFHLPVPLYPLEELMHHQILPLMEELGRFGSYAAYQVSKENEQLKLEIAKLKEQLGELRS